MEESYQLLEACVNEFFNSGTTNERKRQIEALLDGFSKQSGSWKQALYCLSNSRHNQYMLMYCLSVIENAIKCQWLSMNQCEQMELKSTLYSYLIQHATSSSPNKCPTFIRNKIVKVLTDVGKFSWPQSYPEFFSNIFQISQSDDTVLLGVLFLKTISEEWSNVKDEVSTYRKNELKVRLVEEMRRIFDLLHRILDAGLKQMRINSMGSTPPPSPTNPLEQNTASLLSFTTSPARMDLVEIISLSLETTGHYSSWIPLDGVLGFTTASNNNTKTSPFPVGFVQLLCQFALFDTATSSSVSGITHSVQAMRVLNEILYRKFIPKEFDEQLTFIVRFGVELLNKILNLSSFSVLQDQYMEKVIEFLCLVVSSHFHRYDEQTAKAIMSLLLPFTFKQEDSALYYECLEIWTRLLNHLIAQITVISMTTNRDDYLDHFKQPILALANGIVHSTAKFQIKTEVTLLDNDDDEDADTRSLVRNIDILVKIGELLPTESLESLVSTWSESCRFYVNLQSLMEPCMTSLKISNPVEIDHFNFIVQMIGRMANIFYGDVFKQELALGKTLYQQLVNVFCFSKHFYLVKNPEAIVKSNCEIVYSLRTWTFWLSRFHSEIVLSESTLVDQQLFFEMLSNLMDVIFFTLDNQTRIDLSIVSANANLFATLVNIIRTQYIFQSASVQTLIQQIHNMKSSVDKEVYRALSKVVATVLLLPWQSVSQQEWETRTQMYESYMKLLLEELCQSVMNTKAIVDCLGILNDQLDLVMTECSISKKMCWNVIKEVVPFLQKLSSTFLRQSDVSEQILNFFLKIMEVLRQQTGAQFFEETIRGFLSLFSSENLINDLLRETESSSVVVEKFLQMLQFMVKDPSPSFRKFLPEALSICYDHVYPVLAQRSTPDLKIPFFQLIRDTLNYRWNYFFPTLVLLQQNASPNSQNQRPQQDPSTGKRLDEILQSIGHSFLQPDLEIFRFNLATLTSWNEKHNLYQKLSSHGQIIRQFMTVLLQVLVQKSHDLLRDELARVLHEMASVDFLQYRTHFLPEFLQSVLPTMSQEQRLSLCQKFGPTSTLTTGSNNNENIDQIDLPSFTLLLNQFLEDLRYFYFYVECQRLNSGETSQTLVARDGQSKS